MIKSQTYVETRPPSGTFRGGHEMSVPFRPNANAGPVSPNSPDMMNISIIPGSYDRLVDDSPEFEMTPFQLQSWRDAWQPTLGARRNSTPITVTLAIGERTLAILPLAKARTGGLNVLEWHAGEQSDYGGPVLNRGEQGALTSVDGKALMRTIAESIGDIDLVRLTRQPRLIGSQPNPFVAGICAAHHCDGHAINFRPGETWDEFLARRRGPSTRQQVRKKHRKLLAAGDVRLVIAGSPEEARQIAESCLRGKSRQLAALKHHDPFGDLDVRRFVVDYFSSEVGRSTWAVALTLDGAAIASAIGFRSRDEWFLFQMSMDAPGLEHVSPGAQMFHGIMQHCIDLGVRRLDLGLGDEPYKFDWCDEHIRLYDSLVPMTLKGALSVAAHQTRALMLRKIAAHPAMYDWGKSIKRRLSK